MSFDGVYSLDGVTLVLLCVVTALFLVYFRNGSKSHVELNFPPGPTPLPIIGNLHLLDLKKPDQSLMELSEKYGPIFSIKLGTKRVVVLTGYETVKDALINHPDEFGGRAHIPIFDDLTHGYGIIFSSGESWKQMRRFTMSTLRDFGMGKKTVEDKIIEEAHFLIKLFESCKGQEFNPTIQLNAAVANIICSIVFGDRFDYDDERFIAVVKRVNKNIQLAGSPMVQLYNAFPILGFLPGSHKKMLKNGKLTCGFVKDFINKSRQTLDANVPRSFIDVFNLKQQQESGNPNTYFHENNLIFTVTNLFGAGMETTSTTLRWAMLLMMKYPQIQEKVHDEITTVVGSERFPRTGDRKNLPYTDAVIHEIQRFANIVPLNIMHSTTEDVNFKGYFLPKGTSVIPLLTSVLFDKTQWENPFDFNPSNFLNADGKFVKRDAFAPFSMGRRACAGETLARMELFLFFTILIQRFRFQVPPNVTNLELTSAVGFTSFPKYQNVCAVRQKVHDEITTIIGSERFPRTEDRKNLPYTNAVIHEIQRFANIVPLNLMHSTTEDVNIKGYFLPKGTPVMPLLTSVLYDKTQWESPNDFNPSIFLDADGKFVKRDAFAPFSMGRRAYAGETLARMELFLFFTILIQRFRFQVPPNVSNLELVSGIIFVNGESWKQMRRFSMSTLRDFVMGKKTIEDKIIEEADFLIKMFESHKGQEFNPTIQLNAATANIICSILFGDRFDYEDKTFIDLVKRVKENTLLAGSPVVQLYNTFPILGFLPGSHKKMLKNRNSNSGFLKNFVTKNYQTLDANDPRSFIDAFMLKQQQESGNPNTYFHENNLIGTVIDLFNAGTESTSNTLHWAMLLMMKYPQIQEKVHDEIITVIGSEQFPRTRDRKNLPYTNAVIHEIQRFANVAPLNLMHSTTEDVNIKGYFLPKGTPVIPLLTSVLYDKTQWESPNDFNPSNFLDADGKFVKRDAFAPFSMGRRACAGETLARMELFLFFTKLIQRFRFQVPPNVTNLELVSNSAFTSIPNYPNVWAVHR
ncbi:uncharacterized protein LOC132398968 [Hypanus sabinus]|uniref:uncharacterized protein LOC132398968 n=1 Tax=Hypanus sabinus TaxID=79690 RepID=UPI0028C392EA|nr:uncharacterized protein LOC132398968 [Hypanus sabinus]